ncbi:rho-related BTB domain-containing protein 3 isoform X3 [Scyliorhinus canicula]|uniref:rho-related BTB domain-containing protein 3 isoform X3 n=1 Tax=Scyliorhinus canicula TaxID=7830 RepID=UPI0018F3785A|nr:rho-related BTB domain-containing protein 3 isoform X3 [Scyliorhinus canicula]
MSVRIVALGNEKAGFEDSLQQPDLITTYFGRHAIIRHIEERRLLSFATNITFPAFTEYHAYVFGRVQVLIHDCPNWDLFDNDWYRSRNVVGLADIIVLKYSVNDKTSFQEVKDNYVPMIKRILNQWTVPVIVTAVGTRQNEEGPPCSCPLCTSDKGSCVPFYEGIELSKEIGAAYLELHSLNDFYVGKYFGGVLEYFIIQCLKQKSSQKKKKRSSRPHIIPPPTLREPGSNCWDELKSVLWKKLENPEQVKNVMEILKQFFKCNAKAFCPSNFSNQGAKSKEQSQSYCCSLSLFFQNPGLADVVFIVQGTSMYAHKAVLVARCEVMAAMFSGCYAETKACQVPIQGVSKETFLSFLEYLYTDACCTASILQAMALLICAEMYQIHRLQQICESYIVTQLQRMPSRELVSTNLSMVNLYNKAKFHNATRLSTWLLHFIASNYLIFSQKLEFQELSEEEQAFVENHRWPSSSYLQELTEYRHHIHSGRSRCILM